MIKKLIIALLLVAFPAYGQDIQPLPGCSISGSTITCGGSSLTPGTGTVSSVSVTTANGVSGTVATSTTTPAITIALGAITPSSVVASGTVTAGSFIPTSSSAPTDGYYLNSAGQSAFAAGSTRIFFINSTGLLMNNAAGATLTSTAATALAPTLVPRRSDSATGVGSNGTGSLSLVATSIEQLRVNNGSIYVGGASTGADAAAVSPTVSSALSTGAATNPDLVFQTGVKTTSGSAQATPTTAITIKGETQIAAVSTAIMIGSATPLTLTAGAIGASKMAASGSAPGAAGGKFEVVCGAGSGSLKLIMYGGTSATPVTIVDNVGSGAAGC